MRNLFFTKIFILWAILFSLVIYTSQSKAQANVYVSPSTTVLSGQNTVTVDFMIENVTNIHAYSVNLRFNDSVLEYQAATQGPFLSMGGGTTFLTRPSLIIDSIEVNEAILGLYSTSGSGKLFSITFNVLTAGSTTIDVVEVDLRDIDNNNIPVTWNSGEVIVPLSVNLKLFLQGPFNSVSMNTTLNSSGYLPLIQPYSGSPWNYSGTESVSPSFFSSHPDIVDWVLIELRTGTSSLTLVDRRVGFLLNNGTITDIDGTSLLYLNQLAGNYFIVIYHRNHISIMNSSSAYLDYVSSQYDFTDSQSKAYGTNSMVNLGGGYYGLPSGDSDGSGTVNAADRSNTWNQRNLFGYYGTDVDLSGSVNAADRSIIWNNRNISTQVPD